MVTITVTDVNEAPMVTGATAIDLAENLTVLDNSDTGNVTEGAYTVTDADEDDGQRCGHNVEVVGR